jgi:hypothetical protein
MEECGEDTDECAFSCPVRAQETEDLPFSYLEGDVVHRLHRAVPVPEDLGKVLDPDDALRGVVTLLVTEDV